MRYFFQIIVIIIFFAAGCKEIDVREKIANIPNQEWKLNHKAIVEIDVKDSAYQNIFFLIRHTEKFEYTIILANLSIQDTGKNAKPISTMILNIPLVNEKGNWAGDNMSDLYYHRVKISQPVFFKPDRYKFIIEHGMKDNPLKYVLNVGVAIEKASLAK